MYSFRFLLIATLFSIGSLVGFSQTTIQMADGSPLKMQYCYEDTDYELIGLPAGGTFSGCGVFERNGRWYVNPVVATVGVSVFPISCNITYTPPTGNPLSRNLLMWKPVVISPALQDTFTCNGDFYLNATTLYAGAYEYTWTPGVYLETPDSNNSKGTITASQVFKITAKDYTSGCIGGDSILVEYKVIHADVAIDKENICPLDTFQLTVTNPQQDYNYQWIDWGKGIEVGTEPLLRYAIATPGEHKIDLVASNDKCVDTISTDAHVQDVGLTLTADPDLINQGAAVTLTTNAKVPYQVTNWYPEPIFPIQTAITQTIRPDSSRYYSVVARSYDDCKDSASVYVLVNPRILVPTAFTPNNDGQNDYFKPQGIGDDFRINVFQVYNRLGQLVYSAEAGVTASGIKGWDGTVDGKPANVGTYFFYLEILTHNNQTVTQKGDVTLIR